jgi:hypothetical protein
MVAQRNAGAATQAALLLEAEKAKLAKETELAAQKLAAQAQPRTTLQKLAAARIKRVAQAMITLTISDVSVSYDTDAKTLTAADGTPVPDGVYGTAEGFTVTVAGGVVTSFVDASGAEVDPSTLVTQGDETALAELTATVKAQGETITKLAAALKVTPAVVKQGAANGKQPQAGTQHASTEGGMYAQLRAVQMEKKQALQAKRALSA